MRDKKMDKFVNYLYDLEPRKIPFRWNELIPCVGLWIRDRRVKSKLPSVEEFVERHGNFEILDAAAETFAPIERAYIGRWHGRNIEKNILDKRFTAYHLATGAIPLIYGIYCWINQ